MECLIYNTIANLNGISPKNYFQEKPHSVIFFYCGFTRNQGDEGFYEISLNCSQIEANKYPPNKRHYTAERCKFRLKHLEIEIRIKRAANFET